MNNSDSKVQEGNKLIAEFSDAWEFREPDLTRAYKGAYYVHKDRQYFVNDCDMKYHSSWDWLMPVVEKINTLAIDDYGEMGVYIYPHRCLIGENEHNEIIGLESYQTPLINLVWQAVIQFIHWYNTNINLAKQQNEKI